MGIVDDILREAQRLAARRGNTGRTQAELNRVQSVNENTKAAAKKKKKKKSSTTSQKKEEKEKTSAESRRIDMVSRYRGGDATSVTLPDARFDSLNLRSLRGENNTKRTKEEMDRRQSVIENSRVKEDEVSPVNVSSRKYNPLIKSPTKMAKANVYQGNQGRTEEELDRKIASNDLAEITPEQWLAINMKGAENRSKLKGTGGYLNQPESENFSFSGESSKVNMANNVDYLKSNWQYVPDDKKTEYALYLIEAEGITKNNEDIIMDAFEKASAADKWKYLETEVKVGGQGSSYAEQMRQALNADPDRDKGFAEKLYGDNYDTKVWTEADAQRYPESNKVVGETYTVHRTDHNRDMLNNAIYSAQVRDAQTYIEQQKYIDKYIADGNYKGWDAVKDKAMDAVGSWWMDLYDAGVMAFTENLRKGQEGIEFTKPGENLKTLREDGLFAFMAGTVTNRLSDIFTYIGLPQSLLSKAFLTPEDVEAIQERLFSVTDPFHNEIERRNRIYESADLNPVEKFGIEVMGATIEMVPGILASIFGTPAAGMAVFGTKAGGAAAKQAYREGASLEEAVRFGLANGVAEAVVEKFFTGFGLMGKGVIAPTLKKLIPDGKVLSDTTLKVLQDSGFMDSMSYRILKRVAASGGEATEEMIMEIISPYLERATYNPDAMNATWKEVLYSGGLGAAVGTILGIPVMISEEVNASNRKKDYAAIVDDFRKQKMSQLNEAVSLGEMTEDEAKQVLNEIDDTLSGVGSLNVSDVAPEVKISGEALDAVYDTYEEASKAMKAEAKTKANGERISANYIDNGEVKTFTTAVENGGLAPGTSKTAAPEYQKIAQAKNVTERSGYQLNVKEEIINEVSSLSKAIGREVEFYRNGDASDHGYMNKKTGKIYVNADSSQSAARSVIAHELTHQMENTAGWKGIVELMKKHYGSSYESRRQERIDAYEAFGKPLKVDKTRKAYDEADQELVAMFVEEKLLTDADTIREVVNTDKTLAQKIIAWINKVIQKLAGNKEQKMLVEARDLWNQALQEEQSGKVKPRTIEEEVTDDTAETLRLSIGINGELAEKATKVNAEDGMIPAKMLKTALKNREQLIKTYETKLIPDIKSNTEPAIKQNQSYGVSYEPTTICSRSLALEGLVELIAKKYKRPLTSAEQIIIAQESMLYAGDKAECLFCYQANAKRAYENALNKYLADRRDVIRRYNEGMDDETNYRIMMDFNFKTGKFRTGRKDTDSSQARFNTFIEIAKGNLEPVPVDLLINTRTLDESYERTDLPEDYKIQFDQIKEYARGASRAKGRTFYSTYRGEILDFAKNTIEKLNSAFGLRMFSFSEFSPAFMLEYMQVITDASIMGLKMLAYTKEPAFVEVFHGTNIAINVSLAGVENPEGGYDCDGMQSMDWNTAKDLRSKYDNVGTVYVAKSDKEVKWALAQDWIDTVIPFHISGGSAAMSKDLGWKNYTSVQSEKSKIQGVKPRAIYPPEFQNDEQTYLDLCEKYNVYPKFNAMRKDKSYKNYMKLVNETRQKPADIKPVQPVFDMEAMDRVMKEFSGEYDAPLGGSRKVLEYAADEISEKVKERRAQMSFFEKNANRKKPATLKELAAEELRFADLEIRRSVGKSEDAEYMEAVESGDMITAQRMVDEAAEVAFANSKIRDEDGKLIVVYHGTDSEFNVFDRTKSRANMDIQGNFFSPWEEDAAGYGSNVRKFYLNITNPASESTGYKALRQFKGQDNAGVKARDYLEQLGYDGVNNENEEYIAFNSNQIKSADPITYDDKGNIIPLSERFNEENNDIRWSVGSSNKLMRDVINDQNRKMREVFHRRNKDDREALWAMIEDEEAYIARTGGYRHKMVQDIIDFAYETGYRKGDDGKDVVNSWGRESIYIPEKYRGEMETLGGLAGVNREMFGSGISFTYKKKGGGLDDAYRVLREENEGMMPDTMDPSEQVQTIIDLFGTGRNMKRLKELDDEAWEEFGQEDRPFYMDIEQAVYSAVEELSAIARVNMVDAARELDQKTIAAQEKALKKAENQKDFTKQEKADLREKLKENKKKYNAELERRRKEADAEWKVSKKSLAKIAKEYEKGNAEKAREFVEEEQKRIDSMYRKTDKELRKEKADAIVKEYFKQRKPADPNSTESTWLKSKSVKNIVDQFRRETITQLVYAGRLTVTNDNVIIDENQQEVAVRKDDMWDFSEVKNTYTPYFGMTLLAKQQGIDVDQFFTMFAKIRDMQTRPKEDFKERSRKEEVVSYINSLNLTKKQKEFLYYDAARYAKSTMPAFLDGGSVVEEKGNIRGRMMEALDNISFDMFKGHLKENSRWAKEDSAQIRQKDINDFVEMMFGAEDSVEKDAFLDIFTRMIVDYSEQMEEVRLVQTSNLLINKPKQSDPLKMRVVRAYREAKQNFLCEGEAYERMAEKMKNPLIRARYYQAKSAVATANEMINGKHQRNLAGDLMGKSLYRIFEPIFKADTKAKNSNGIELLTELVNNRHDIYRQKNGKGYTGNTIEECETIVENISTAHPEILKVADELVEYGRNLLRMCVECGRLSQKDFDYFVAKYPYYVPAYRVEENEVMDRSGKVRRDTAVIKTAKFGNRDVLPLWDQMVRRTNEMVKACKKNQLAYELVKTTRYKGHEDFVSSVTKTIDQGNTENTMADLGQIEDIGKARRTQEDDTFIPWYCNGEKFDVDIADASLLYGWDRINYRMDEKQYHRVLRKMNSFRRAVLTQYNPTFWLTNHIRDISDLFLYNQHAHMLSGYMIEAYAEMFGGKLAGTKTFQKAYKKATGKEYVYNEEKRADALERYLSKGASQASIFEYDNTNAGRKTTKGKVQSAMKKPLEAFDAWNFMFEQIPRLAVFNETIDRLTKERDKGKNEYTDEEIESIAAYQAADATLNFGRSGTVVKNLNTYGCTFLNAGVQGMDRARRMFTQIKDNDKKTVMLNLCGLVFKIFSMGYSVHIILDWIYGGDDEYANAIREFLYGDDEEEIMQEWKEMSDYNKMNYLVININGVWFRIPQGRLSAFLYSFGYNGEKVFDGEMDALDLVEAQWDMAKETVLFGNPVTNNIFGPLIDANLRNKDAWGNDIVSEWEDMGEGFHYLEYDEDTSMAAIKAAEFGHWLTADLFGVENSRILDFSPKKLDYVMKQYFGSYANLLMPFLDGGTGLKDKVTEGLAETLFKKFYINPVESNRLAGDYYDLKEEFENTAKAHDNDSPYAVAVKVFDDYNELLKPLREQITAISDDSNLTAAEKAEQILALREEMNQIYRDAVADARDALGYAHANYYGKDGNSDLYEDWQRLTKGSDWVVSTMSDTAQAQFAEVSKTGVDAENFVSTYDFVKNATADKDENGKSINGSKKEKIVNYINSLDLTAEQKMSLYTNVAGYKVSDRSPAPDFVNGALVQPSTTNMASPLSGGGELTSGYGWRNCPFHGREFHAAVDISAESGTDVGAVISGTVTMATVHGGYGNSIEITSTDENGNTVVTKYNHLLNMGVEVGDVINQGTKIGEVGSTGDSTGPHLDFRLKINNDWVDPTQYIDLEASGIVNATGYTQKEGSGGTASGGGSSNGGSSGGSSRSGSTASVGSRTSQVASNRRSGGLTLPSVGGSGGNGGGSRASTPVVGRSTSAPTYGSMGITLPRASDYTSGGSSIRSSVATTQRTGRTGGSFWNDNILS